MLDSIKAEVKAGTCHCEVTNPGGGCCLGEITKELKTQTGEADKRTVWTSIGLGMLGSACCWLPLALAGLGVATGTLGARIAWMRPWALGGLLILFLGGRGGGRNHGQVEGGSGFRREGASAGTSPVSPSRPCLR